MNSSIIIIIIGSLFASQTSIPLTYDEQIDPMLEFNVDHLENYKVTAFQGTMLHIDNNDKHNITLRYLYDKIPEISMNIEGDDMFAPLDFIGRIEVNCENHAEEYGEITILEGK